MNARLKKTLQNWQSLKPRRSGADPRKEAEPRLLPLITLTETIGSLQIKRQAEEAVLKLVRPLGRLTRENHDRSTVRGPILARLLDSVHCFPTPASERLVEAFLEDSAWPDKALRGLFERPTTSRDMVCAH